MTSGRAGLLGSLVCRCAELYYCFSFAPRGAAPEARMAKYPLIKTTLKDRLLGGHYPEGLPLPSEPQLAREFEVSRMTARRAIDELEREGYVYYVCD